MSGKKIYSDELKLEIVQRYLKGDISLKELAAMYHVNKCDIQKWKAAYAEHGTEGLCTTHGTYTGDFKICVVEYMHNTGASMRQTAAHFNIPSMKSVSDWNQIYLKEGREALYEERRGKACKMGIKKTKKKKNQVQENEDLLEEIERLRMENEYLKKLNALIQERERLEKPTK